jgi:hypothetical protein
MTTINHIAIIIAMEAEAEPLLKILNLTEITSSLYASYPCKLYSGTYSEGKVSIILQGKDPTFGVDNVGTVPGTKYI